MRTHLQPHSGDETGPAMSNVDKLQKALEAAENMTDAEYEQLYNQAKGLPDIVSFEEYDYLVRREKTLKEILPRPKL